MQYPDIYTEEELVVLYDGFIKSRTWGIIRRTEYLERHPSEATFDDFYQEARVAFLDGIRREADFGYPLKEYTIGVCSKYIYSHIFEHFLSFRGGVSYPHKSRMAKNTQYLKFENIDLLTGAQSASLTVNVDQNISAFELSASLKQLSSLHVEVARAALGGMPRYKIMESFGITRRRLENIYRDIKSVLTQTNKEE